MKKNAPKKTMTPTPIPIVSGPMAASLFCFDWRSDGATGGGRESIGARFANSTSVPSEVYDFSAISGSGKTTSRDAGATGDTDSSLAFGDPSGTGSGAWSNPPATFFRRRA